ncbi:MAG: HEPN domain-containing protein [Desulfuromonadales bacterium]
MNGTNSEIIAHRLIRADETLEEARIMAAAERWNATVNRLYYACFYAISALLLTKGLQSSKHTGVRGLFSTHFVRTGQFPKEFAGLYNSLFDTRNESDYEDFFSADPDEVLLWLEMTPILLDKIKQIIYS